MAHRTDRGCELIPIARNLAHLPENLDFEVWARPLVSPSFDLRFVTA